MYRFRNIHIPAKFLPWRRTLPLSAITCTETSETSHQTGSIRVNFCAAAAKILVRTTKTFAPPTQKVRKEDSLTRRQDQSGGSLKGRSTFSFSSISRLLVGAGFPPLPASSRKDDGWRDSIQYYWFKCPNCKQVVADYPHGYSRFLVCPKCNGFARRSS